jgi:hypothetical protein
MDKFGAAFMIPLDDDKIDIFLEPFPAGKQLSRGITHEFSYQKNMLLPKHFFPEEANQVLPRAVGEQEKITLVQCHVCPLKSLHERRKPGIFNWKKEGKCLT